MPVCVCVLCGATINDFTPKVLHLNFDSNFVPPPPPPATPPIDRQTDMEREALEWKWIGTCVGLYRLSVLLSRQQQEN